MTEEKLILDNINLIYMVLKRYGLYKDLEEYFDIGMIGLVRGAKNFDASKGYAPSTYLVSCITAEVLKYCRGQLRAKRGGGVKDISIYTPVNAAGREICLLETIPSNENIEENMLQAEKLELMYKELSKLKERDKFIICSYYELLGYEKLSQKEIAKKIGIGQAGVCRVIKKFIKEVRRKYD